MSYRLVANLSEKVAMVVTLYGLLGVSRSGHDGSRQRALGTTELCAGSVQLKGVLAASGKVCGSRRLCAVLGSRGLCIGRCRMRR